VGAQQAWLEAADPTAGRVFRSVSKAGEVGRAQPTRGPPHADLAPDYRPSATKVLGGDSENTSPNIFPWGEPTTASGASSRSQGAAFIPWGEPPHSWGEATRLGLSRGENRANY
jgi:hypothetical protein